MHYSGHVLCLTKQAEWGRWWVGAGGRGFSLIELLVVLAVVAVLTALVGIGVAGVLGRARQAQCANNLRQIGVGLQLYADEHGGAYPTTTHTAQLHQAWIYQLERYLDGFDEIRVCPADPRRDERRAAGGTSYILNSFVFVPKTDPFGRPIGRQLNRVAALPAPDQTILAFCCSDHVPAGPGNDHTQPGSDRDGAIRLPSVPRPRWCSTSATVRAGGPASSTPPR
jgi:prepilin-type N-terminal cleavage/methylation domain-containing protein